MHAFKTRVTVNNVTTSLIVNCKYYKFRIFFLCNVDYLKLFLQCEVNDKSVLMKELESR